MTIDYVSEKRGKHVRDADYAGTRKLRKPPNVLIFNVILNSYNTRYYVELQL
jgi:hypothetical protein